MAGFGVIRARIGIRKDTGGTKTRERGDRDGYFIGIEVPLGEEASDIQYEGDTTQEYGFLAYNAYWTLRKVNLGWNLCMEIRGSTLTCISRTRGEKQAVRS